MLTVEIKTVWKTHLYRTSPGKWEKRRCFPCKKNYWWWNLGSSLRLFDKNTVTGVASSSSPRKKKFKFRTSEAKGMATVFWSSEGSLWMELLETCATINSKRYMQTLKSFKQRIRSFRSNRKMNQVLLLDNTRPQTSLRTTDAIATVGGLFLFSPQSQFNASDLYISGPVQDIRRGRHLTDDDELKHRVCRDIQRLRQRCKNCIDNIGDCEQK
jgi:hypothetical protein